MPKRTNRQWACDRRVIRARRAVVLWLKGSGYLFKEIAMVLHTTPDQVRRIHAKGVRG